MVRILLGVLLLVGLSSTASATKIYEFESKPLGAGKNTYDSLWTKQYVTENITEETLLTSHTWQIVATKKKNGDRRYHMYVEIYYQSAMRHDYDLGWFKVSGRHMPTKNVDKHFFIAKNTKYGGTFYEQIDIQMPEKLIKKEIARSKDKVIISIMGRGPSTLIDIEIEPQLLKQLVEKANSEIKRNLPY